MTSRQPLLTRPIGKWVLLGVALLLIGATVAKLRLDAWRRTGLPILESYDSINPPRGIVRVLGIASHSKGADFRLDGLLIYQGMNEPVPPSDARVMALGRFRDYPGEFQLTGGWWYPAPKHLLNRHTWFDGRAVNNSGGQAVMVGDDWKITLADTPAWSKETEGKTVRVHGDLARTNGIYVFSNSTWSLAELDDQVDTRVTIEGRAWSMNGHWWLHYRGVDLHVEDAENAWPPLHLEPSAHAAACSISGVLRKRGLPRIDQIMLKRDRDIAPAFILEDPTVTPLPRGLSK